MYAKDRQVTHFGHVLHPGNRQGPAAKPSAWQQESNMNVRNTRATILHFGSDRAALLCAREILSEADMRF